MKGEVYMSSLKHQGPIERVSQEEDRILGPKPYIATGDSPSMKTVKIAMVQMDSVLGEVEKNVERVLEFIHKASEYGAELVIFPELVFTGYHPDLIGNQVKQLAAKSNWVISRLEKAALEKNITIISGISTLSEEGNEVYNSAVIIDALGKCLGIYNKAHAFGLESSYYKIGNDFPVFSLSSGVKIGLLVCYDAGFPEVSRILAINGAELLVCPAAWIIQEKFLWESNLRSRALDNLLPIIGVNRVGQEKDYVFFGGSQLINSKGECLYQAGSEEGISIVTVDFGKQLEARSKYNHFKDLRLEMYANFYKQKITKIN
jgi:predicted amidohydrolase